MMVNTVNNYSNHVPVSNVSRNVSDASQYQGNDTGGNFYRPTKKKKQDQDEENKKQKQKCHNNQIDLMA